MPLELDALRCVDDLPACMTWFHGPNASVTHPLMYKISDCSLANGSDELTGLNLSLGEVTKPFQNALDNHTCTNSTKATENELLEVEYAFKACARPGDPPIACRLPCLRDHSLMPV